MNKKIKSGRNLGALTVAAVLAFSCGIAALPKSKTVNTEAAPAATAETGRSEYRTSLSIDYSVPSEPEGWTVNDSRVTASGHKIGAWGGDTAWCAIPASDGRKGGVQFSFTGNEDGDRTGKSISEFYTYLL